MWWKASAINMKGMQLNLSNNCWLCLLNKISVKTCFRLLQCLPTLYFYDFCRSFDRCRWFTICEGEQMYRRIKYLNFRGVFCFHFVLSKPAVTRFLDSSGLFLDAAWCIWMRLQMRNHGVEFDFQLSSLYLISLQITFEMVFIYLFPLFLC